MIKDEYKTKEGFVLMSVTRRTSHLISTKWEPQSERNKYIETLG